MTQDYAKLVADLDRLLRLRSIPFGMKMFTDAAEMEAIPRIRRPQSVHTLDQVVAQAARLGWTVGASRQMIWLVRSAAPSSDWAMLKQRNGNPASIWSVSGTPHPMMPRPIRPPCMPCRMVNTKHSLSHR